MDSTVTHPKPLETKPSFLPRVWLVFFKNGDCEGQTKMVPPATEPYLSLTEHEHLVRMARAAAFEELVETTTAQAEDPGLWFQAETAAEEYVQMHLRELHRIIESKSKAARASGNRNEN